METISKSGHIWSRSDTPLGIQQLGEEPVGKGGQVGQVVAGPVSVTGGQEVVDLKMTTGALAKTEFIPELELLKTF